MQWVHDGDVAWGTDGNQDIGVAAEVRCYNTERVHYSVTLIQYDNEIRSVVRAGWVDDIQQGKDVAEEVAARILAADAN